MKRFVFTLQAILDLRLREENDAKQELADKEMELHRYQQALESMQQGLQHFQEEERIGRAQGRSVIELRTSVSWRNKLKLDILQKAREMQDVMVDIDRARRKLIECTKKRRGLEILRENAFAAWKKERDRRDQLFMDELAQNAHIRKQRQQDHDEM